MSTNTNSSAEQNVGEILSRSEHFIEKYKKPILIGVGSIVLLVVLILGIRHAYILPKEREAEAAIFKGEALFAADQWKLALHGDSINYIGFEGIIDSYGFTKTAKLAKAYAGICYYHLGEYENAIKYLKKFSADDAVITPAITGLIGDCYVDLGKAKDGVEYFLKAASKANNEQLSPIYLKKAGVVYESLNEYKKALEVYNTIKNDYPNSKDAVEIDKFIDRAEGNIK